MVLAGFFERGRVDTEAIFIHYVPVVWLRIGFCQLCLYFLLNSMVVVAHAGVQTFF
jgi:hypothetical protein